MPSFTLNVPKQSPLHKKLVARVRSRVELALRGNSSREARWTKAEETTLAYIPETEADASRRNRRESGRPSFTTLQIPYSYAVLMSAHTYWTSVFFARSPIHQYTGWHGEGEKQVLALEALINYQVEVGAMMVPYYVWLYDAGKYGAGVLGSYWEAEKIHYGQIVEIPDPANPNKFVLAQSTNEVKGYEGNKVYNVSPWDFRHDPRVTFANFQQGEFCCSRRRLGWNAILRRVDAGYYIKVNVDELKEHVTSDKGQSDGSSALERPDFSKFTMAEDEKVKHPAGGTFWEVYIELVPDEWGLGKSTYPQKWCFTITEDLTLLVGASPLGYIHGKFPFSVLECEVEGYGIYGRGIPDIIEPIQNTMDWLLNTHFYNVRASLNNQFIVDPSKLVIKDAKKAGEGFIWRLRPEAYGTDITKMFHQIPVTDVTRGHMGDLQQMLGFGEKTLGVNDQIMGALSSGGRKTATEVRASTGFGVNRQKTITEYMSAMGFSPHSRMLVQSSQQYYSSDLKLRIVGDLSVAAGPQFTEVTPDLIAGSYNFVPVDGTLPVDRMAQANLWKEIMAGAMRMPPQIAAEYDWSRIFAWAATIGGLKNINQFRVNVVPDAQLQQQAQAGNVIPMPQRMPPGAVTPGNSASTQAGLDSLGGEYGE